MYLHKVKLNLIEISPLDGYTVLTLQVINQPDDYPTIYSYGSIGVAIPSENSVLYEVGKNYDLDLNEVIIP